MFDKKPTSTIDIPAGEKTAGSEDLVFFTMPAKYRGGNVEGLTQPQSTRPPVPQPPPPPQPPKAAPKPLPHLPQTKHKKGNSATKALIIAGVILVAGMGFAAWVLVSSLNTPDEPATSPPPTTTRPVSTTPPTSETPDPPEEPSNDRPTTSSTAPIKPGTDTDSDGLTDIEEEQIYKTNPALPDSDGDGFLDGNEVFHRYNPNGDAPGTLLGSGVVTETRTTANGINLALLYPTIWEIVPFEERSTIALGSLAVQATTGEQVGVQILAKPSSQTLQVWVEGQKETRRLVSSKTKTGYPMLMTIDKLKAYVDGGTYVVIFEYIPGPDRVIDYLQTFQMMLNSLSLDGEVKQVEPPEENSVEDEEVDQELEPEQAQEEPQEDVVTATDAAEQPTEDSTE